MAWERRNRRSYYYESRRVGGRVEKIYLGSGPVAAAAARGLQARRAELREGRRAEREFRDQISAAQALFEQFDRLASALAAAGMLIDGFRQHKRGEWRRSRG